MDVELQKAIEIIRAGNKENGRKILSEYILLHPQNETAYLWLAVCAETQEQKVLYLQKAVEINPDNQRAKEALDKLKPIENPSIAEIIIKENSNDLEPKNLQINKLKIPTDYGKSRTIKSGASFLSSFHPRYITALFGLFVVIGTMFTWAQLTNGSGTTILESYSGLSQATGILTLIVGLLIIITSLFIQTKPMARSAPIASAFAFIAFLVACVGLKSILFEACWAAILPDSTGTCMRIGQGGGYILSILSLLLVFISGLIKNPSPNT